ncbi:hypothetical protein JB92DRAFT_1548812 [Gautieria morchelliformis]|nr:hypothetical protein JB92DRAFT_1548812 [Gautieria morchelliformis]
MLNRRPSDIKCENSRCGARHSFHVTHKQTTFFHTSTVLQLDIHHEHNSRTFQYSSHSSHEQCCRQRSYSAYHIPDGSCCVNIFIPDGSCCVNIFIRYRPIHDGLFIFLRRRITRNSARKMDQVTSFDRGGRDSEEGNGKIQEETGLAALWSTKKEDWRQHVSKSDLQKAQRLNLNVSYASPAGAIPVSIMPASRTPPHQPVVAVYSSGTQPTTTSVYPIPLEAAHHGRSPEPDIENDDQSPQQRPVSRTLCASHPHLFVSPAIHLYLLLRSPLHCTGTLLRG